MAIVTCWAEIKLHIRRLTGFKKGARTGFQEGLSRGLETAREALAQLSAKGARRDRQ